MDIIRRRNGRLIRKSPILARVARLDMAWRRTGKQEGRLENALAFELGQAGRAGFGDESRRVQCYNAAQLGERSGWEAHVSKI